MKKLLYNEALREALIEEMKRDKSVIILGEDVGTYGGVFKVTDKLEDMFGFDRVRDTPISEGAITGISVGAAISGYRPVAEIMYMDWISLALDQLVNQASLLHYVWGEKVNVPMVLRTQGVAGATASAQHSKV